MPYLHLPVQSGSDRILSAMNRHYTQAEYLRLVDRARERDARNLALSTDIIVGFPGETDEDFAATLQLVGEVGFDQAFTFIYSPRDGTPAPQTWKAKCPGGLAGAVRPADRSRSGLCAREIRVLRRHGAAGA